MAEIMLMGLPLRMPFRDPRLTGRKREKRLRHGGVEETRWRGGYIQLGWEVRADDSGPQRHGMPVPRPVFVVEWHGAGVSGSGVKWFDKLEDADEFFDRIERENIIHIAAKALGVL
jgi:hypothetical protein